MQLTSESLVMRHSNQNPLIVKSSSSTCCVLSGDSSLHHQPEGRKSNSMVKYTDCELHNGNGHGPGHRHGNGTSESNTSESSDLTPESQIEGLEILNPASRNGSTIPPPAPPAYRKSPSASKHHLKFGSNHNHHALHHPLRHQSCLERWLLTVLVIFFLLSLTLALYYVLHRKAVTSQDGSDLLPYYTQAGGGSLWDSILIGSPSSKTELDSRLTTSPSSLICLSSHCLTIVGSLLKRLNTSHTPCHSLYGYSCGSLPPMEHSSRKSREPDHKAFEDLLQQDSQELVRELTLDERVNQQIVLDLINWTADEDLEPDPLLESKTSSSAPALMSGRYIAAIRGLYTSCMAANSRKTAEYKAVWSRLRDMNEETKWPPFYSERDWSVSGAVSFNLTGTLLRLSAAGLGRDFLFALRYSAQSGKLHLFPPTLYLPGDDYQRHLWASQRVRAYRDFLTSLLVQAGYHEVSHNGNENDAIQAMAFEAQLYQALNHSVLSEATEEVSFEDLQRRLAPSIQWYGLIKQHLERQPVVVQNIQTLKIVLHQSGYWPQLNGLLSAIDDKVADKRRLANHLFLQTLVLNNLDLSRDYKQSDCAGLVGRFMLDERRLLKNLAPYYQTILASHVTEVKKLAKHVRQAFLEVLASREDYFSNETLEAIKSTFSASKVSLDPSLQEAKRATSAGGGEATHSGFLTVSDLSQIRADQPLMENLIVLRRLNGLVPSSSSVDLDLDPDPELPIETSSPVKIQLKVNFNAEKNSFIVHSSSELIPYKLDLEPGWVKYASTGFDLANKLVLHFDSLFNDTQWMSNDTLKWYRLNTACIKTALGPKISRKPFGRYLLGDNFALDVAAHAYAASLSDSSGADLHLPGLDKFSFMQLFFLHFSHTLCGANPPNIPPPSEDSDQETRDRTHQLRAYIHNLRIAGSVLDSGPFLAGHAGPTRPLLKSNSRRGFEYGGFACAGGGNKSQQYAVCRGRWEERISRGKPIL